MNEFYPFLLHIANILTILGILFSDNLKLRTTLFIAAIFELSYGMLKSADGPIWEIAFWSFLAVLINGYYTFIIAKERMGINFTPDEKTVKELTFSFMDNIQFNKIMNIAKWDSYPPNTKIIEQDSNIDKLIIIFRGTAKVEKGGKEVAVLKDGNFAGEMSYITGNPTNANVITTSQVKILYWERKELDALLKKENDIKYSFHSAFNIDFLKKLND